jgi:hypothetical protein
LKPQFLYTVRVPVRPRGAEGIPTTINFNVMLDVAQALCGDVMNEWHKQQPEMETLLSSTHKADFTINGIETCGVGVDFQFQGVPTP